MAGVKVLTGAAAAALLLAFVGPTPVLAETIEASLVRAYQNNPQLNAQRASVRVTDENVPQALSGYRPRVSVTASGGYQYTDALSVIGGQAVALHGGQLPRAVGATVTQNSSMSPASANWVASDGPPSHTMRRSPRAPRASTIARGSSREPPSTGTT